MTTAVQATRQLGTRPITGILVPIALAGIGTIAALAVWLSSLWVAGAIVVVTLTFLLFRFPRIYVYIYFGVALVPYSLLRYLDEFRLFGRSEASVNLVGLGWVLNVMLFAIYTFWKRENWWRIRFYRPFLVLVVLSLSTVVFTNDWMLGLRNWVHLVSPICLSLLLLSTITSRRQAMETVRHIFLIYSVVLAVGLYQMVIGTGSYDTISETYRLSGNYGQGAGGEVAFAAIMLYLSCLAAPLALRARSEMNASGAVVATCALLLLLASQSRMPLLGLFAAAVVMLSKSRVSLKYWLLPILILAAAQLSPRVYSRFGGPLLQAPAEFRQNPDMYVNLIQRAETWRMLSHQFLDTRTLLLGRGFGFVDHFLLQELDDPLDFYTHSVHNEYLRILLDLGLVGVFLLVGQLVLLYRIGSKLASTADDTFSQSLGVALCALVVSFAALAVTSNMYGIGAHTVVFWVLGALSLACLKWTRRAKRTAGAGASATSILQRG